MKVLRFIKEWIKWVVLYGGRYRDQNQINIIYSTCEACPFFEKYAPNADFGNCGICGCHISREPGFNKAAWASTRCPDKPPKWKEDLSLRVFKSSE